MKIRLLSEKDVRSVSPALPEIVALVEQAYRLDGEGRAEVPTKIGVHPERANTFLHAMPAWVGGARALGMKWVSYFPGNLAHGQPDSTGIIILNDPDIGLPCCIMEGMYVTFIRTAACGAVAAKHVLQRPPRSLGLIGCGGLGLWSLRVMAAVFPTIEQVLVSSRTAGSRERFCADMSKEGRWRMTPVDDPVEALRNVDIVVSSVPPGDVRPVDGRALAPGSVFIPLDLVNSWQDNVLTEVDQVAADNPAHFVAQVKGRRAAAAAGLKPPMSIQDAVAGKTNLASSGARTMIAVCGIASTDVVVGWEIYRRACSAHVGLEFDMQG
ncbi:ornithine cyclodeaminase family protein [Rhodoplanes sp. Z2-YC6860]|uniref:ornithine cyclodeaminase family protein n=1 Tax=Rhodoplanes sp. Z2-YC6860 TaxID=674703 RepID=UPI00078D47DA|nr:ornithine cyclodeaminase family protein [Rhodoplanes sp. Z2-YC6860]AMN40513.1 ornithine cyclodeaminase [Rhodoplanes sp. Z2-YC6860]